MREPTLPSLPAPSDRAAGSTSSSEVPVLLAIQTNDRRPGLTVWCPYCEETHHHGAGGGLRAAHCTRPESPYQAKGYRLDPHAGGEDPRAILPPGLLAGRERLCVALDGVATALRGTVARAALRCSGRSPFTERRIGTARVVVSGDGWWIDPDAFLSDRARSAARPPAQVVAGHGLVRLLSALYGLPAGIVVGRLLHALAPGCLDAAGWLDVAAAVEASIARQAVRGRDGSQ